MLDTKLRALLSKFGTWLIAGLIILFINSSCKAEEVTTLHILLPAFQVPSLKELITDFNNENKENPKIFIKVTEASDATNLVEDVYFQPNKHPDTVYDLIFIDIIWVAELAQKGVLMNLSPLMSKEELNELKEDFLPKDWNGGIYQDNLYRIPFRSDVSVIYYRKDLLKELKVERPPKTFEELKEIANEWREKKSLPSYLWQGNEYEGLVTVFVEVLEGYGGFWINKNQDDVGLEENAALTAVKFLHDTIKNGISSSDVTNFREKDTTNEFEKGETIFLRNWIYWPETNGTGSDIQNKMNFVPMVNDGKHKGGGCQGGWGFGIAQKSSNQEAAWSAIKFLTSVAAQKKYALKNGDMPSRRSLLNDLQLVIRYSYYPRLLEISENSVLRPQLTNYSDVSKILQKHLSSVLKKQEITPEDIKTGMKQAADETREKLKKSHSMNNREAAALQN